MADNEYKQTIFSMRQKLASIQRRAESVCVQSQNLKRQTESAKVESLQKMIELRIQSEARRRGIVSVRKDPRRLKSSILVATGTSILGGLLTKDGWGALNSGLAGLDGALQRFGRAEWVVLLGKRIVVAASDRLPIQGHWLAWESLKLALEELQNKALAGAELGSLDDVLHGLEQGRERRFIPVKLVVKQPESK